MIEEEIYKLKGGEDPTVRTIDQGDVKDAFNDNIITSDDCYLLFKLTTTYIDPSDFKGKKRNL